MPPRLVASPFAEAHVGPRIVAASTTRHGGVSAAPYATLNCGFSSGDDPDAVRENRRRAAGELGLDATRLTVGGQVHGTRVAVVGAAESGRGALGPDTVLANTDGLLTDLPGIPLAVSTADCVPVFLCAPAAGVVGVLHAGWRGTLRGILRTGLEAMRTTWGIPPGDVHIAFGPAIGPCCFEIRADVAGEAHAHPLTDATLLRPTGPDTWRLDLRGHLAAQAVDAGVPRDQIVADGPCTRCASATYYSYRAEGPESGRTLSMIALRDTAA